MKHQTQILLLALLAGGLADRAYGQAFESTAADVFVEFSGGAIDRDMAAVVRAFSAENSLLPTRKYMPDQTTGLCAILNAELRLAPEFCTTDIIAAVSAFSAKNGVVIDPDAITARQGVVLPDIRVKITEANRIYDLDQAQEAKRLEQLENNPSWRNVITRKETDLLSRQNNSDAALPQLDQLTFQKTAWQFSITDPSKLAEAEYLSRQLGGLNLSIDVERRGGFDKAAHSLTTYSATDHYARWCIDKTVVDAEGAFANLAGALYDTTNVVTCEAEVPTPPEVVIMDQQIPALPDLANAFPTTSRELPLQTERLCHSAPFDRARDHGTLLSTIVAANDNGYGFRGLAPDARIRSFVWDRKAVRNTDLKFFIRDVLTPAQPQVYLFASEFAPYSPHPGPNASEFEIRNAKQIWRRTAEGHWTDQLANEDVRLNGGLEQEVLQSPMLLVASAGQAGEGDEGREITWETPMAPQNLGDHDKLLIVGACVECDKETAALWRRSNRSNEAKRFVSVMAPGGGEIPTYLANQQVGETVGGTSASAAFVAGLAARMASCYPSSFIARPGRLKERIVLASRPVADPTAIAHVTGGVIDPEVSMLDPRHTWLKLKDTPVRPVEFVKWCSERLKFVEDENNPRDSLNLLSTRRLTNIEEIGVVQQSLVRTTGRSVVQRQPPGLAATPEAPIAMVRDVRDGRECAVSLKRMTDLFLSQEERASGECDAVPLCE